MTIPALDAYLASLEASTGLSADTLKAALVLLIQFPLAGLFSLIPASQPTARHLFSIIASSLLFCGLFTFEGFMQLLGATLFTYVVTKTLRHKKGAPVAVFLCTMGHLSFNHLAAQVWNKDGSGFNHTAPMMVLVIKLSSFAWSAHDGTRPEKELSEEQRRRASRQMPGIIEYLGYVFFFAGFLVGPAFEFVDYQHFTMALPPFDRMPSRVVPTLKTLASAVVSLALFVGFGNKWYYQLTLEPGYLELPFWHRFMYLQLAGGIARTKYYVAWKLAESACILAGVGWNGYDRKTGKPRWDRVQNIAIRGFELAENPKMMIDSWNKNTGAWLRNCVYLRITPPGAKSTTWAAIATYITSAFWHGFWPGYYLTFLTGSIINVVGRELRRNLRPLFVSPSKLSNLKPIYDVLAWALTIAVINYTVGPFMLQTLDKSLTMMKRNYFIGHVGLFVIMVGFKVLGWGKLTRKVGAAVGADFGAKRKAMNGDVVSEAVEVTAPILATDAGVKEE